MKVTESDSGRTGLARWNTKTNPRLTFVVPIFIIEFVFLMRFLCCVFPPVWWQPRYVESEYPRECSSDGVGLFINRCRNLSWLCILLCAHHELHELLQLKWDLNLNTKMINIEVPDQQTSLYLSNAKPSQLAKYPRISVSNIFNSSTF